MQCPSCRAVYSNGLSLCPRCKTPASKSSPETEVRQASPAEEGAPIIAPAVETVDQTSDAAPAPPTSTLIEFPGVARTPQWRKELSERVREIQERRARESVLEVEEAPRGRAEATAAMVAPAPQLGLVPQPDAPQVNPIVAAALKRLERARQQAPPMPRTRPTISRGAVAATARVVEEQYEAEATAPFAPQAPSPVAVTAPPVKAEAAPLPKTTEPVRERQLSVVLAPAAPKVAKPSVKPQPEPVVTSKVETVAPVAAEEALGEAALEEFYDDRASISKRIAGGLIDLLVAAFASSPFAAIIELTNGNWSDWRVMASMGGIALVVMFLYLTASTALAGRTWGMSLVSLRPVDAETGLPPTTKQAVGRAVLYIVSLLTLGFGLLYALFDAEGRTAHDHFSGTVVVRD